MVVHASIVSLLLPSLMVLVKAHSGQNQSDVRAAHLRASARGAVQLDGGAGGRLRGAPPSVREAGDSALGQDDG